MILGLFLLDLFNVLYLSLNRFGKRIKLLIFTKMTQNIKAAYIYIWEYMGNYRGGNFLGAISWEAIICWAKMWETIVRSSRYSGKCRKGQFYLLLQRFIGSWLHLLLIKIPFLKNMKNMGLLKDGVLQVLTSWENQTVLQCLKHHRINVFPDSIGEKVLYI